MQMNDECFKYSDLCEENLLNVHDDFYAFACDPDQRAKRYSRSIVGGIRYHTNNQEQCSKTLNSGVVILGDHDFYGAVLDIFAISYLQRNVMYLFKCDWWDVRKTKYRYTHR